MRIGLANDLEFFMFVDIDHLVFLFGFEDDHLLVEVEDYPFDGVS